MGLVAGRAQRSDRNVEGDPRGSECVIRQEARGKGIRARHRQSGEVFVAGKTREMIVPGNELVPGVQAGR